MQYKILILGILILGGSCLRAQTNGKFIQIKLVTIEPGAELTSWWGHTGLIVEDTRSASGAFYNYGLFSFEQKNFLSNFARGRLIFWVGAWEANAALDFYKNQNRTIRIQTLNLPPHKRRQMAQFLAQNVKPENREYLYDHYYDNCATRVRDLIDMMVGGRFKEFTDREAAFTLRELTRKHTHRNYFMDWLLMFLMNDTIDQPIRKWDEMFLPVELERYTAQMMYTDSSGNKISLVGHSQVFYQAENVYQVPAEVPSHWPIGLLAGASLALIGWFLACYNQPGRKIITILLGIWHFLIGIIFGVPGLALFFMSFFTDHTVTYHNENLLLANPLTAFLLVIGLATLWRAKFVARIMPAFAIILLGIGLLSLPLKILPAFDQDNLLAMVVILPVLASIAAIWNRPAVQ